MPMLNVPFKADKTLTYDEAIDFFAEVAKVSGIDIVALLGNEFDIRARYIGDGLFEVETEG